jgi:predicted Zn-dependent peptidase
MSKPKRTVLDNGAVVISQFTGSKDMFIGLGVRCGFANDPPAARGLAHLVEHLYVNKIPFLGKTYSTETLYCSEATASKADSLIEALADAPLSAPDYDNDEMEIIKVEKLEQCDKPEGLLYNEFYRLVHGTEMYAMPAGRIDQKCIDTWHAQHYMPNNLVFLAVGNLKHEMLVEKINRKIGKLRPAECATYFEPKKVETPYEKIIKKDDLKLSYNLLIFDAPNCNENGAHAMCVISGIIEAMLAPELNKLLVYNDSLDVGYHHSKYLSHLLIPFPCLKKNIYLIKQIIGKKFEECISIQNPEFSKIIAQFNACDLRSETAENLLCSLFHGEANGNYTESMDSLRGIKGLKLKEFRDAAGKYLTFKNSIHISIQP